LPTAKSHSSASGLVPPLRREVKPLVGGSRPQNEYIWGRFHRNATASVRRLFVGACSYAYLLARLSQLWRKLLACSAGLSRLDSSTLQPKRCATMLYRPGTLVDRDPCGRQ
jgi:hypothetical protein